MAKYAYPAIFTKEKRGYSVRFPDIDGCYTCGDSLPDAIEMAEDALCLMLYDREEEGASIPPASDLKVIQAGTEEIASLVCCDTLEYRKFYDNQAVKKTLTVPAWLDRQAKAANVNFSQVLQDGLKQRLNIQ